MLGEIYMFAMCNCCDIERWTLMISNTMDGVLGVLSCEKFMLLLM